jgi:hypothetical protein
VRAAGIALRTAHLLAMAGFAGGVFSGAAEGYLALWRPAAIATGALLLLSELAHGSDWPLQGRGFAAIAHVAALGLLGVGGLDRYACGAAIVLGSVGSHMPKALRGWSPFRPD